MPINVKKTKRRRYIRYPTEVAAVLIVEKSVSVQCRILDFCHGGFFLELTPSNIEIPMDKSIKLRLEIISESGRETTEIHARAVHVTPVGVGVAVDNMPATVINALTRESGASGKDRRGFTPTNIHQENCRKAFKQLLLEKLPLLLGQFYETLDEDLEKASQHVGYLANSSQKDDLLTTLRLNREMFVSEYSSSVISLVDYISVPNRIKTNEMTQNLLSLIDEDEFEDWLEISAIVRKLNMHFEESIFELNREFAKVFGLFGEVINNPFSPEALCNSFREIVLQFELGNGVNSTLYHGFEKILIEGYLALCEQAIVLLSKHGPADAADFPGQPRQAADHSRQTRQSRRLPAGENTVSNWNNPRSQFFEDPRILPEAWGPSEQRNLQPITQITGKLLAILNDIELAVPEALRHGLSRDEKLPSRQDYQYYSTEDVVSAISQIQDARAAAGALHLDSAALNRSLQEVLDGLDQGGKTLPANVSEQLEIYGKFFETLFKDFAFSPEITAYLEKMYLPLLSLPLQGNDFLDDNTHPVRSILNQLAALEPALRKDRKIGTTSIKNALNRLVEQISSEAGANPAILTGIEQELNGIAQRVTQSIDLKIKRIIEAHEDQQNREIAKRSVGKAIDQRLAGRPMPAIIALLLESGWQELLVTAELNKEKHPEESLKYLSVLDDLIFWHFEQDSIRKIQANSIKATVKSIADSLKPVCPNPAQRKGVIEELTSLLLGVGPQKMNKRAESVKVEAVVQRQDDDLIAQVEQLGVGDWLMIARGATESEPMKLVWIGNVVQVYVFVNRDVLNTLELGKSELVNLLRSGGAHKIESLDTPLMDRATDSMLQKMHEQLVHNATHDPVTDLCTRDQFIRKLKNEMSKLDNSNHMLCHVEVLDLRDIANICGDEGSEQLLRELVRLIAECLRHDDLLARLGHKSFAILYKHCSADDGHEKSKKLIKLIGDARFQWREKSFTFGVSMGLVPFNGSCFDLRQLLQQADSASILAERSSQQRILLFTNEDENLKNLNKLYEWIGNIDNVLSHNRLFVRCQMIADVDQGKKEHRHYEILLGIRDEAGGIIPPDQFIPAVERCKRMPEIDRWIIVNVFGWIEKNRDDFDRMDGFSINLSGQSINSEVFLEFLKDTLESSNVPADKLVFEITETVASENLVFTKRFMNTIKQYGCKFSLDDFGSGYSSYSYLKNLNIDYLKIDGAFVKDIANSPADIAIVKSMNEIGHSLGLKTIAEYVENDRIREILKEIGVDYVQGYGVEKPIPLTELVIPSDSPPTYFFEDNSFWDL